MDRISSAIWVSSGPKAESFLEKEYMLKLKYWLVNDQMNIQVFPETSHWNEEQEYILKFISSLRSDLSPTLWAVGFSYPNERKMLSQQKRHETNWMA